MQFLVFGKNGQVAREIARLKPDAIYLSRDEADLMHPDDCAEAVRRSRVDAVINAAAWTDVDGAEELSEGAMAVNAHAPGAMAQACAELGLPFVQISTDYVFDGTGERPFLPDDPTGPLGVYGASKLAGEHAVRASGAIHAILRTSWVFSAHGSNFVSTMLNLSRTRNQLTVVADQVGGPTPAAAIADASLRVAAALVQDPNLSGTYHFSGAPDVSWADFARAIFRIAGRRVEVEDVPSSAYPRPAKRPRNSRLDCRSTEEAFGLVRPDWQLGVEAVIAELSTEVQE